MTRDLFNAAAMYDDDRSRLLRRLPGPADSRWHAPSSATAERVVKRLFGFPEIRDWCLAAGFTTVQGYGENGTALTVDDRRMIVVAGRQEA
ncbi:hypothetical protein AB0M02_38585 [Actinoplanes sp. NPDC051861]|uniref:hypothetical protein n=1 Tax=Actinoplanes sp. NPDC051861 TaxID=3155170 RepID=UPI003444F9E3